MISLGTEGNFVYPNPATDVIYVSITSNRDAESTIWVTDLFGKIVRQSSTEIMDSKAVEIDIHDLPAGLYGVIVHMDDKEYLTTHFVITR